MRILFCTIGITALLGSAAAQAPKKGPSGPGMTLTSTAFTDGGEIPAAKYTQVDPNQVSPKLEWTNVPGSPATFALIMHDPDVARNRTPEDQLHWLIFNIPGTERGLPEAVPADAKLANGTIQAKNAGGVVGYRGPGAPAPGPYHHYTLELFALDSSLELGADATRADVLKAMEGHIMAKAVLVGRFHRP